MPNRDLARANMSGGDIASEEHHCPPICVGRWSFCQKIGHLLDQSLGHSLLPMTRLPDSYQGEPTSYLALIESSQ